MILDLSPLNKAISSLTASMHDTQDTVFMASLTPSQRNLVIAGTIQNFEFCYELCWKFMKRWLSFHLGTAIVDGVPRRELFRLAHQNRLIDQVDTWMQYHRARNQTSHTYDEEIAEEIFHMAQKFCPDAQDFQTRLTEKNEQA